MRALGLGIAVIALAAASALLDAETGVANWLDMRASLVESSGRVAVLEARNDALRREIEQLELEPSAHDRVIREELDLALPGEVVVHFEPTLLGPTISSRSNSSWP